MTRSIALAPGWASSAAAGWRDRLNHPLATLLAAGLLHLLLVVVLLALAGGDASTFVTAGDQLSNPTETPPGLTVRANSRGYDGQYFYRLALEPWPSEAVGYGIRLDRPPYRHQRVLYPLLAGALALGQPLLVPWTLIGLNLAAVLVLAWLAGALAQRFGRHALEGLLLALYPGLPFSLSRDLAEPLAAAFLLGSILAWRSKRPWLAGGLLSLAVLTRETALLAAGCWLLAVLLGSGSALGARLRRGLPLLLPLATGLLWQAVLRWHWGRPSVSSGQTLLRLPLSGPLLFVGLIARFDHPIVWVWLAELALMVLLAGLTAVALRGSTADRGEKLAWGVYGLFVISLSRSVWTEDWAFMRALTEAGLFGGLILLGSPVARWRRVGLSGVLAAWGLAAFRVVMTAA